MIHKLSHYNQFFNWVTGANTARVLVKDKAFYLVMEERNRGMLK